MSGQMNEQLNSQSEISWPSHLKPLRVRIARPTDKLAEVVAFYRDVIGLKELGSFQGHAGYDGVILGLPGWQYYLEFTQHVKGSPCPSPSRDNLLVFYLPEEHMERLTKRMQSWVTIL